MVGQQTACLDGLSRFLQIPLRPPGCALVQQEAFDDSWLWGAAEKAEIDFTGVTIGKGCRWFRKPLKSPWIR